MKSLCQKIEECGEGRVFEEDGGGAVEEIEGGEGTHFIRLRFIEFGGGDTHGPGGGEGQIIPLMVCPLFRHVDGYDFYSRRKGSGDDLPADFAALLAVGVVEHQNGEVSAQLFQKCGFSAFRCDE